MPSHSHTGCSAKGGMAPRCTAGGREAPPGQPGHKQRAPPASQGYCCAVPHRRQSASVCPLDSWLSRDHTHLLERRSFDRGLDTLGREGKGHIREGKGHIREGKGHIRKGKGHIREGKGHIREGKGHIREGKGHIREGKGHIREGKGHIRTH